MERGVLVVGESLVDIVQTLSGHLHEYAGGSAANVAVALARLGRPTRLATSFAADHHGEMIAAHLERAGVVLACDPAAVERTSTARGHDRDGGRGGVHLRHRLAAVAGGRGRGPTGGAHLLARGGAAARRRRRAGAARPAARRATVTYDVNARPAVTGTGPDVVGAGRADGRGRRPGQGERRGPRGALPAAGPRRLGGRPAGARPGRGRGDPRRRGRALGGPRGPGGDRVATVQVADTIGAGDTFGAGLLDALWERGRLGAEGRTALAALPRAEVTEVLEHAARAAAVTVSRPGADPPYRHEL